MIDCHGVFGELRLDCGAAGRTMKEEQDVLKHIHRHFGLVPRNVEE